MNGQFSVRFLLNLICSLPIAAGLITTMAQAGPLAILPFSDNVLIVNGQVISGGDGMNNGVRGNGKVQEESRSLDNYRSVRLDIAADVVYEHGDKPTVKLQAESNILPLIKTEVAQGRLRVYASKNFAATKSIKLHLQSAHLNEFVQKGAGDVKIRGVDESVFKLDLEGQSDVDLAGKAHRFTLNLTGSGDINAKNLIADDCAFSLAGSSDITAHCGRSVSGSSMGAGDIEIYGKPKKRELSTMGASDIDYQ